MRYLESENPHILARFTTGDTVTIDIYDLSDSSLLINSAAMTEVSTTGHFKYHFNPSPTELTEYLYIATNSIEEHSGKIILGGYPDRLRIATEIRQAAVNDPSPTTKQFVTTLTETKSTFWERAGIRITSGQNEGIIRAIHTYNGTTKQIGLKTGLPYAPANGDTFIIGTMRKFLIPDIDEIRTELLRHDNKITGLISMDDNLDLSPETWLMFNSNNDLIGIRKFGKNRSQYDLEVKDATVSDRTVDDTKTIKYSEWVKSWESGV